MDYSNSIYWSYNISVGYIMKDNEIRDLLQYDGEIKNKVYYVRVPLSYDENQFCLEDGGSKNKRNVTIKKSLDYYRNKEHIDLLLDKIISEIRKMSINAPTINDWPSLKERKAEIEALKEKPELTAAETKQLDRGMAQFDLAAELKVKFSKFHESKELINQTVMALRNEQKKLIKAEVAKD